jgi:hypothetical protein
VRTVPKLLLSTFLVLPVSLCAAQEKLQPQHAPDGGTVERFASISIPSMPNAPFSATVNTEWIRQVPDGSRITLKNHRTVARDAKGRIYQERALFVPEDGKHESTVYQIEISDPATHEQYVCRPAERVCRLRQFFGSLVEPSSGGPATQVRAGSGPSFTVENLGAQTIAGLETVGSRETHLLESGALGNEAPILERKEFWYSPQLGINLITKRQDPRFSTEQNFEVTNITAGEPDLKLFEPPAGYKIIDARNLPEIAPPQTSSPD